MSNPVLVELQRGTMVESVHRGRVAVVDADGALVAALGDVDALVYPRSAVKALQALPLIESGAADALGLSDAELALACASHGGEEAHVQGAAAMLAKAGAGESVLECGAHWPYHEASVHALVKTGRSPGALHNNCSGKHAGFVCLGCHLAAGHDWPGFQRGYVQAEHPVMREVGAALGVVTGSDLDHAPRGIDGCSIPTYGIALRALALGFARFGAGIGLREGHARAARRLRVAVAAQPFMVAGTGRFDTRVMERLGARVFCKVGAEAVYCAALPERGLGVAVKIDDGNTGRAAEVAMAALIEAYVPLSDEEASFVRSLSDAVQINWRGIEVGRLRAGSALRGLRA